MTPKFLKRVGAWIAWKFGPVYCCVGCVEPILAAPPIVVDGEPFHDMECFIGDCSPVERARFAGAL